MTQPQVIATTIIVTLAVEVIVLLAVMKFFSYLDRIGSHANGDTPDSRERTRVHPNNGGEGTSNARGVEASKTNEGESRIPSWAVASHVARKRERK